MSKQSLKQRKCKAFKYHSFIAHPRSRWKWSPLSVFNAKTLLYVRIAAWTFRGREQAITGDISLLLSPSPAPLAFNGQALPKGQPDIFKRKMPFWGALSNYPGHTHTHTHTVLQRHGNMHPYSHTNAGALTFISLHLETHTNVYVK